MSYLFVALSYLIGSINFAYLVAKYKKLDISSSGSGNPGTSNVMRTLISSPAFTLSYLFIYGSNITVKTFLDWV